MSHIDPRVEQSRRRILRAALDELAAAGYGGFALESVATRAGVGRSTVYRHWDSKLSLIADALETLNVQPVPDLPDGTPRAGVELIVRHLAAALTTAPFSACVPALVHAAEQNATVREFHHRYAARRRENLVAIIAAGVDSGDFPPGTDPELAAAALAGAVFYRRLMTGVPLDPDEAPALVDTVLGAGRGRSVDLLGPAPA